MKLKSLTIIFFLLLIMISILFFTNMNLNKDLKLTPFIHNNPYYLYIDRTQIDSLKESGKTGKGIKVAIIDSGISSDIVSVAKRVSYVEEILPVGEISHATISALLLKNDFSPNIELYSIQALNSKGVGTYSNIIRGIDWCIENDVNIIMFSFTGHEYLEELHKEIKAADQKGIIMIAAAGNYSSDNPVYPAAFPEVISVGAIDSNGNIADYSDYGTFVNIYAPGDVPEFNTYGTSFAVPYIGGVIALLKENNHISNDKIKEIFGIPPK